jgi:hypothetical protein
MSASRPLARTWATLAAGVTAATLVVSGPAAQAATIDQKPVSQGASWLTGQLTKNLVHNEQYQFDDIGLSIDVALGLHAAHKKPEVSAAITRAVARNVAFYVGDGDQGIYAGATAKAAWLAQVHGKDPRAFGGLDLVSQLEGRVASAAPITGRIEDAYDPTSASGGDYANVIGQAYAAEVLALADSPKAAPVASFLLEQQCSAGYFRLGFTADKTAKDQSCDGAPKRQRAADTDATAIAVLALRNVPGAPAEQATKKAVAWLTGVQAPNGSFGGGTSTKDANTNSTGLAGWALTSAGALGAATKAAVWVRNLQVAVNPCAKKLAKQGGAIAYDQDAYGTAQGFGIKKKDQDQWRRASAQALPVLTLAPAATGTLTARAPGSVASGAKLRISLTGVAPGQRVCVVEGASSYEFFSGRKATSQVTFVVASDPGARTFHVWAGNQRRDVTVRVTG